MESSEDDAGASRDAPRQTLARENTREQSSGEVNDESSYQALTIDTAKEYLAPVVAGADEGPPDPLKDKLERLSPAEDDESHQSTEAILLMIDKFVEGSGASRKAKRNSEPEDPVCDQDSAGNDVTKQPPDSLTHNQLHLNNCYAPGSSADRLGAEISSDRNASPSTTAGSGQKTSESSRPAPDSASSDSDDMVNIVSSTERSAVIVPVKNNTKVISESNIISSSEQSSERPQPSSAYSSGDVSVSERTFPVKPVTSDHDRLSTPVDRPLEIREPLDSHNPASVSRGFSDSLSKCESADSSLKPENAVIQRRKLIRPTSSVLKSEKPIANLTHALKSIECVKNATEKTSSTMSESPQTPHDTLLSVSVNDPFVINKLSSEDHSDNAPSMNVSPKKVKLVRHSNFKILEANPSNVPIQPKITNLPEKMQAVDSGRCSPSSFDDGNTVLSGKSGKIILPVPVIEKVLEDSDQGFQEHFSQKSTVTDDCPTDVEEIVPISKEPEECRNVNKVDYINKVASCVANASKESTLNMNENAHGHQIEREYNSASLTNNLCLVESYRNITTDKSNEVLDVRKVSPLKLNLSMIDESLTLNPKKNAANQKISSIESDESMPDEGCEQESDSIVKNVPKLTLKLSSILADEIKLAAKPLKLNIKPLKPPDSEGHRTVKNQPPVESTHEDFEPSKIPNIVKLNIKPIQKPPESKSSSSSEISESDSSESDTLPTSSRSLAVNETGDGKSSEDQSCPPVPKLTIKSLSTTPKVDCDGLKLKVSKKATCKVSESLADLPSPTIPKLTFKPLVQPPIEKMTIKINKAHEFNYENKCDIENSTHPETIPKLTLKKGKPQESVINMNCESNDIDEEKDSSLKLTIKLGKSTESASENKIDSSGDSLHIPKASKRNSQKADQSNSEPIPKLTIKIPQDHELRNLDRIDSPSIPKLTIKPIIKPEDHTPVPKLNIKPILKPSEEVFSISENDVDSTSALKITIKTKQLNIKADEPVSVPKINFKPLLKPDDDLNIISHCKDDDIAAVKPKNNSKHGSESHESQAIPKLTIKPIPIPENMDKPLEIVTTCSRTTPGHQESGQDSPRIILKINKTVQGSTSEIITEKTLKKSESDQFKAESVSPNIIDPIVPKLTIKIPQEHNTELPKLENSKDLIENESNSNSPVGRIKLKLTKEGSHAKIVNMEADDTNETSKENVVQVLRSGVKRPAPKEEASLLLKKVTDVDKTIHDAKRVKLDQLLTNSNLTVTRIAKVKNMGNIDTSPDPMPNVSISVLSLGSREEKITSDFNKTNSKRNSPNLPKSNATFSNNGESKLQDILSRLHIQKEDKSAISPVSNFPFAKDVSVLAEADSNTTSTTASSEGTASEPMNLLGTDSPVFNKVDGDMMTHNEGSSSQECMMLDDLSQDPLDIGSIAKSHFVPVVSEASALSDIKNSIVNIMAQGNANAIPPFVATPRKRGRPRKSAIIDTPVRTPVSTPALEERPVRSSRTPRDRPTILRTPRSRGRGRGRGSRRASMSGISGGRGIDPDSPLLAAHAFFLNLTVPAPPIPHSELGMHSINECQVKLPRLGMDLMQESTVTEVMDHASDASAFLDGNQSGDLKQADASGTVVVSTGRGRGRGSRGPRRSRGGRGSRGSRGGRGSRGARTTRTTPDAAEEMIQLQDPVAISEIRRDGRKSKLEITRTPALQVFEEETCMIGDIGTPHRTVGLIDEESQSSVLSGQTTESGKYKRSRLMDMLDEGHKDWTPADVAEYDWPSEPVAGESPQTVMIQEQVALYLGVKSFKRRYPDLKRRALGADEKNYIRDRGLISEALCDLGVTAVDAGEVLDIMFTDFPTKYEEYRKHLRENRDARPVQPLKPPPPPHLATLPGTDRSKQESMEKACESAAEWNAQLNRQRKTIRSAVVDLQTFTLHRPRRPPTLPSPAALQQQIVSHYPVALLPGQYTDHYRTYSPEELRYFPLNSVLRILAPPVPTKEESSSDESGDDSDSVGSSGDESGSETSEKNFKRKSGAAIKGRARTAVSGAESSVPPSRPTSPQQKDSKEAVSNPSSPLPALPSVTPSASTSAPDVMRCKLCAGTEHCNRRYPTETFVTCATCHKKIHPSCLEMAPNVAKCVRQYAWQCADCKCCAHCQDLADDDKMLFCDLCDRGYHIYCVGLRKVPTGRWHCSHCAVCRSCNARHPSGQPESAGIHPPPLAPAPPDQWHHHLKKTTAGQKRYSHTLCTPCARAWRAGRYCSVCERCFMGRKGAMRLVICTHCDRRFHQECVRQQGKQLDVLNYTCSGCRRGGATRAQNKRGSAQRGGLRRLAKPPSTPPHHLRDGSDRSNTNADSDRSVTAADHFGDSSCANDRTDPDPDDEALSKRDPLSLPDEDGSLRRFSSADPLRGSVNSCPPVIASDVPARSERASPSPLEDVEMEESTKTATDPLRSEDDDPLSTLTQRVPEKMTVDFAEGRPPEGLAAGERPNSTPAPIEEMCGDAEEMPESRDGGDAMTSDPLADDAEEEET